MVTRLIGFCVAAFLLSLSSSWAGTVRIAGGSTYPSIQAAVNAAVFDDVIQISTGMFYETIIVVTNTLNFEGGYDESFTSRPGGFTGVNGGDAATVIWFLSSTCSVDQVNFLNGTANAFTFFCGGGAVLNNSRVQFRDSPIYSNAAVYGGGLFVDELSFARLTGNSPVHKNIALWRGGGIHVKGELQIEHEDSDVFNNVVSNGYGGGIWVDYGRLDLTAGDVYGNRAISEDVGGLGGGIGAEAGDLDIGGDVSISNNWTDVGGGLGLMNSTCALGRLTMGDVSIDQNLGDVGGGIGAIGSQITCRGLYLRDNYATTAGGGGCLWFCNLYSDTNLFYANYNRSWIDGGGLYLVTCTASLDVAVFGGGPGAGNRADGEGGAIYMTNSTLFVQGGQFIGNQANFYSGNGGAIWAINSYMEFTNGPGHWGSYTNVIFQYNLAGTNSGRGGAIYLTNGSYAGVFNVNADFNSAYNGGVLYAEPGCPFLLNNCRVDRNRAVNHGGAICSINDGMVDRSVFSGNVCGNWGGAIYADQCTMDVICSSFIANTGQFGGSAVAVLGPAAQVNIYPPSDDTAYSPVTGWASLFEKNVGGSSPVFISAKATADISRVAFLSNSYAAISVFQSYASIRGSVFDANPISATDARLDISDCTILDSVQMSGTIGSISNSIVWNGLINTDETCHVTAGYCLLNVPVPGPGIITNAPFLYANYHLKHYSPGIGVGRPVDELYLRDIDGELRFAHYDIGFDVFEDTDHDRLPTVFETRTGYLTDDFNQGTNPTNADTDADGVLDGDEWMATTDPNQPSSCLKITGIRPEGAYMQVFWQGGQGAYQVLESCSNEMPTGVAEWNYVSTFSPPTPTETNELALMWNSNTFYRIRAYR
jgi:predicted outer membrane repeat protein